ncbi:hypothetical protein quinque_016482 [Culex quinquefasciatus]
MSSTEWIRRGRQERLKENEQRFDQKQAANSRNLEKYEEFLSEKVGTLDSKRRAVADSDDDFNEDYLEEATNDFQPGACDHDQFGEKQYDIDEQRAIYDGNILEITVVCLQRGLWRSTVRCTWRSVIKSATTASRCKSWEKRSGTIARERKYQCRFCNRLCGRNSPREAHQ